MKQLEKRKRSLMELCQRKRGSDCSQESSGLGPSKKSSVSSMDALNSPPLLKKVVRLQEYEEGEPPARRKSDVGKGSPENPTLGHTHNGSRAEISEMEERVKNDLETGLTGVYRTPKKNDEQGSQAWHRAPTSPLLSDRQHSPGVARWGGSGSATSPTHHRITAAGAVTAPPTFSHHFPPRSPPAHNNGSSKFSHSDSSEWTDFACVSTSGGSVEVGGRLGSSVYSSSNNLSSNEAIIMSEFDPISASVTGDPSKPTQ
jgi:hypothetical protein